VAVTRTAFFLLAFFVGGLVAIAAACSNQGEGERCELANASEDCKQDEGLICTAAKELNGRSDSDRCCPLDRTKATHPLCQTPVNVAQDAATPADSGPAPATDAGSDADAGEATDAADAGDAADAADASDQ
jgi:hypothetical protein